MRKYILKHTQMINTLDTKIILHNYILYLGEPNTLDTKIILHNYILSQLEKFQHSLSLPNIKYNCTILFLCEDY